MYQCWTEYQVYFFQPQFLHKRKAQNNHKNLLAATSKAESAANEKNEKPIRQRIAFSKSPSCQIN
jgi:K+-transporting ATPase c subunit